MNLRKSKINKQSKYRFFHNAIKKGEGFTLIELLATIFVLTVGILAILIMFPLGTKIINSSKMAATGIQLGQEKIEEIISLSYEAISVEENIEAELPSPFIYYRRETRITYVDPSLNLQEISTDKGVKKVEVTVSWQSSLVTSRKSVELTTIISKK
ncbi:prepilin-type N-terminal cleavage/methylation domain-containing protein [Patescibacteria group bacterium]|nr:prepilin-type N-terminal cleavage/methylation domain-containing protein [Patescibacteria group bacterium]MBU4274412.1 prepilin-type N-terminal cleavage/methylation domain-containing protein [Patescibacteria group bacterium]MBU4368008.1 prepilin-type N-terminal cleavage/methylation domain-containing protein [Patescibacteria group bacterium]MBU4462243.1 prepilin-type N-terminal cleavage/methylation domain-containing protein [Patescibacteria group bacterium]MCG2699599.1 prepilin-type N-terminal